jgi:hypothetical protein
VSFIHGLSSSGKLGLSALQETEHPADPLAGVLEPLDLAKVGIA